MSAFKPSMSSMSSSFPDVFPCSKHYKVNREDLPNAYLNPKKRAIVKIRRNGVLTRIIVDGEILDIAI